MTMSHDEIPHPVGQDRRGMSLQLRQDYESVVGGVFMDRLTKDFNAMKTIVVAVDVDERESLPSRRPTTMTTHRPIPTGIPSQSLKW